MIKVRSFTSQDDFEKFVDDYDEDKNDVLAIVRENGGIACDLMTSCKSYKTAIKRFLRL